MPTFELLPLKASLSSLQLSKVQMSILYLFKLIEKAKPQLQVQVELEIPYSKLLFTLQVTFPQVQFTLTVTFPMVPLLPFIPHLPQTYMPFFFLLQGEP